ncbi:MAG: serine protease, partial [Chlamydiia bacterium]|nr:serine protease [Chlamydiia bacterium]
GAAEPILQTTEGMQTASEKINSALRADFANRASFYGRNPLIAEAMVDKDMILVLRGGKFTKLDKEEQIRSSDIVVSAKGKLLTLNANQIMEYGVGDIKMEPAKRPLITTDERSAGKWPANKMLLFHQPFFKSIPNATIDSYKPDWKTSILTYLASPIVASALFMGLLIGFYVEINTPGFGLPGAIGLTCLFLIILSSYSIDAVNWLELILIGIGVALILVDLFLIPSFGIVGGLGILLALGGLFALMIPGLENIDYEFDTGTFNAAGEYALRRLAWLSGGFIVSLVIVGLLARYLFPLLAPYSRFVLAGSEQTGYTAGISVQELPAVGSRAEALTDLRPTGKIEFEGKEFEAMSEGSYIEKGSALRVTRHEGNVLYVERDV